MDYNVVRHTYNTRNNSSILDILSTIDVRQDVKVKAEELYKQLKTTNKRDRKRRMATLYCVLCAQDLVATDGNDVRTVSYVAEQLGLSRNDIRKTINMFTGKLDVHNTSPGYTKAITLILQTLDDLGFDSKIRDEVNRDWYDNYNDRCSSIDPAICAIGYVYYYLIQHRYIVVDYAATLGITSKKLEESIKVMQEYFD